MAIVSAERKPLDVWQWLPGKESGFAIEMCSDAAVTVAEADNPYGPIDRFLTLIRETDRFRFVGSDLTPLEPCRDEFCQRVIDGMETERIDPSRVARYIRSTYPGQPSETLASGNLTFRSRDDLPP